jgi:hypothetical protein
MEGGGYLVGHDEALIIADGDGDRGPAAVPAPSLRRCLR